MEGRELESERERAGKDNRINLAYKCTHAHKKKPFYHHVFLEFIVSSVCLSRVCRVKCLTV